MTATYDEASVIYGTSLVTYDGTDSLIVGTGLDPEVAAVAPIDPEAAVTDTTTPRSAVAVEV